MLWHIPTYSMTGEENEEGFKEIIQMPEKNKGQEWKSLAAAQ